MEIDKDRMYEALQQIFYDVDEELGQKLTIDPKTGADHFPSLVRTLLRYYSEAG